MKIKILIPVYNDWKSVFKVLDEINNLDLNIKFKISVIIINDASNHDLPDLEKKSRKYRLNQSYKYEYKSGSHKINCSRIKIYF